MKVIVNSSCLVQPAEPTWIGRMPLTESDQIGEVTLIPIIYFYKPEKNLQIKDTMFATLKTALSKVLVHFYPVAGRLTWLDGSRLELDCNSKGAQLIEASCDAKLADLGDFNPTPDFDYLVPQINYKTTPIEEIPILIAQLTRFSCGGITLTCSIAHAVTDGHSAAYFTSEWARLARGEPLGTAPFLDRKLMRAGDPPPLPPKAPRFQFEQYRPPPLLTGHSSSESESRKETEIAMLKLSKFQVEMLKKEANLDHNIGGGGDRAYSRYESIVGHIWRCACRARGHAHEQPTGLGVSVDVRRRMQPPLPENFFGNAIECVIATGLSGELLTRPLSYAAGRIREAINRVTSEYVHSAIDYLKNLEDFSRLQDIHGFMEEEEEEESVFYGNPNMGVMSWLGLSMNGVDFGWGKEIFMSPVMDNQDGSSYIMPGYDGDDSLMLVLCLQSAVMEDFKKFFYQDIHSN